MNVVLSFFKNKIVAPITGLLKQGITPDRLAIAISVGIIIATVPLFGTTTIFCLASIWLFRLNPVAVLLVNQLAYPLQFVCYIPLIRSGEWLFNAPRMPLSIPKIFLLFSNDLAGAIRMLWWSTMYGLTIWILLAIPVAYGLYRVILPLLKTLSVRKDLNRPFNP